MDIQFYVTVARLVTLVFFFTPGIQTSENAKFYARGASFDSFSNEGKTLVVQFTVKHEQKIDCGGGYLKVGWHYYTTCCGLMLFIQELNATHIRAIQQLTLCVVVSLWLSINSREYVFLAHIFCLCDPYSSYTYMVSTLSPLLHVHVCRCSLVLWS